MKMPDHVLTLDWCCYPVGEWEIPHPQHSRSGATAIPMCSCGWRGTPHAHDAILGWLTQGVRARQEWERHVEPCRVVLVECHEGMLVRPAHGCKYIPVCSCGWIGTDYHPSKLQAELEWCEDHRYPEEGTEAQRRFQAQRLVDKLGALRDARLEVSGEWQDGQTDTVVVTMV
jgi:hypothetical protein